MLTRTITKIRMNAPWGAAAGIFLLAVASQVLFFPMSPAAGASVNRPASSQEAVEKGLVIRFAAGQKQGSRVVAGETAQVSVTITDAATGAPVSALRPAVWIDRVRERKPDDALAGLSCMDKVKAYVRGGLSIRPEIDLNAYYILAMNDDGSVSVINPLVGVSGRTQLERMVFLRKPGEDWTEAMGGKRLFITMPEAGEVAAVDLDDFTVLRNIPAGLNPGRIALQPDGRFLWVANDAGDAAGSGVTVIDPVTMEKKAFVPTGPGRHEIAFSEDSLTAFVANSSSGAVTVISTARFEKVLEIAIGKVLSSIAASDLAQAVYAASEAEGTVAVIDTASYEIAARIRLRPGAGRLRFAPGGRWLFVVNSREQTVSVIDTSVNALVRTIDSVPAPDRVFFSDTFAYITSAANAEVRLVQLSEIDRPGPLAGTVIYAGQKSLAGSGFSSLADPLVRAGDRGALLIANPADRSVYYYMEGMEVPMGSFKGYGRAPRAVRVTARSITEKAKGVYSAPVTLSTGGSYEAAVLIDSPRVVRCFEFSAEQKPGAPEEKETVKYSIAMLSKEKSFVTNEPIRLSFLVSGADGRAQAAEDLTALVMRVPGTWQERGRARYLGEGVYEVEFTVPREGVYHLYLGSSSLGLLFTRPPVLVMNVRPGREQAVEGCAR